MSVNSAVVDRYLSRREKGRVKEIVTPEGVPLRFTVALVGDRIWAYFIDMLILFGAVLGLFMLTIPLVMALGGFGLAIAAVAFFLLRNFYFVFFEIRWQGATIGKRVAGIRVIDRRGGPLRAEAIFVRNLTREVEVFIPLAMLFDPQLKTPGLTGLLSLLGALWLFAFLLMPLFNRDRLRVGDLVAGTVVVVAPRELLLTDLARKRGRGRGYEFTPEQLDIYGVFELQVLEDVLRGRAAASEEALHAVCEKIKTKIGWDRARWDVNPARFLSDFYAAQRAHLEKGMLLGKRREFKRE